jgi:hypothetical protein
MKNAPTTNSSESAKDKRHYKPGALPKKRNTVLAAVLAALLEQRPLTGMDSVFGQHTTRLAAVIHALVEQYGWDIERREIATGTNDGRMAWITAYWLPQATIAQAFEMGARAWMDDVKVARAVRRKQASKCKAEAVKINAARKRYKPQDPRQSNLWGDAN